MSAQSIPVIHASGAPRDIGRQVGEATAPLIAAMVDEFPAMLREQAMQGSCTYLSPDMLVILAERYAVFAKQYAPDLMEEVVGMAESSGVDWRLVLALNCYLDLFDLNYPFLADQILFGCTAMAASPAATVDGETYVAQNYDTRAYLKKAVYVLDVAPDSGPAAMVLTMAGMVGCAGMNAAGIGLVINNLVPSDSRHGVPYCFIVRKALQQRRLGHAVGTIVSAKRASGINYLLGSRSGMVLSIETTATDYALLDLKNGVIVHTNHYLAPTLHGYDRRRGRAMDTIIRQARASELVASHAGRLDGHLLGSFLSDHADHPNSICCHPRGEAPLHSRDETVASIVCRLSAREMLVAGGQPCSSPYESLLLVPEDVAGTPDQFDGMSAENHSA